MDIMAHKRGDVILDVTFTNLRSAWSVRVMDGSKVTDLVRTEPEFIAFLLTKSGLPDEIHEFVLKEYNKVDGNSSGDPLYRKLLISDVKEKV